MSSAARSRNLWAETGLARARPVALAAPPAAYFFAGANLAAANWPMIAASVSGWSFMAQ